MKYRDQLGRQLELKAVPERIVSLVPSQSEFLWDLGLEKQLVGISKFCIHPETMYRAVTRIGGTKTPDLEKIMALQPDLIIGNKEENEKSHIDELSKEFPVWMSDINNPDDALNMMQSLGEITNRKEQAKAIIQQATEALTATKNMFRAQRVAYFIWNEPYHLAGSNTFIHSLLTHVGFINVVKHKTRYPEINLEELESWNPEICLLSSEPFPFREKQAAQIQAALPLAKIVLTSGETFSWYGSRMIYLQKELDDLKNKIYA